MTQRKDKSRCFALSKLNKNIVDIEKQMADRKSIVSYSIPFNARLGMVAEVLLWGRDRSIRRTRVTFARVRARLKGVESNWA